MGAVMPATASSIPITYQTPVVWKNRTVMVIVCLASVLIFIYHLLRCKRHPPYLPDLTKRMTTVLFPDCPAPELPFQAPFAQGIIQIHPMQQNNLSICCYFDKQLFFKQPITDSIYIPELPYNRDIIIALCHQQKVALLTTLTVSHHMGIYEIGARINRSNPLPQLLPMQCHLTLITPLSIEIDVQDALKIESSITYEFKNNSFFAHILFFKIRGYTLADPSQHHSTIVPVLVPPGSQSQPLDFFHRCWKSEKVSLSQYQIEIVSVQDTLIPWGRNLL